MKCPFCIKVCRKCKDRIGEARLLVAYEGNFYKEKKGKYELDSKCKECRKEYETKRKENNPEKYKESNNKAAAKWRKNNPDYAKEWRENNPEKYKESKNNWRENNPDYFKEYWDKYLEENGLERGQGSIGEQKVRQVLRESNLTFSEQHRFDDCKFKYTLPFDFYIPSLNTIIEYDGEQHYRAVKGWGGEEYFQICKQRDVIKEEYCRDNNIRLIRIPYWEYDNIEQILEGLL